MMFKRNLRDAVDDTLGLIFELTHRGGYRETCPIPVQRALASLMRTLESTQERVNDQFLRAEDRLAIRADREALRILLDDAPGSVRASLTDIILVLEQAD